MYITNCLISNENSCSINLELCITSKVGGFQKWGYLQIIHFSRVFPNINHLFWGTPMTSWKPPSDRKRKVGLSWQSKTPRFTHQFWWQKSPWGPSAGETRGFFVIPILGSMAWASQTMIPIFFSQIPFCKLYSQRKCLTWLSRSFHNSDTVWCFIAILLDVKRILQKKITRLWDDFFHPKPRRPWAVWHVPKAVSGILFSSAPDTHHSLKSPIFRGDKSLMNFEASHDFQTEKDTTWNIPWYCVKYIPWDCG